MVIKSYSTLHKAKAFESHYKIQFSVILRTVLGGASAEVQSVYSTAVADRGGTQFIFSFIENMNH